jgi:ABC-2 type transport system ATP-binding protein
MIETHQLGKQFGNFQAVHNLTLNVKPGEVLALLGPNGAGKTTTVRMLSAILKPTSGWARIAGLDVVEQARLVRSRVGLLTEYPGLYNRMNALDYLQFFGSLLGMNTHASFQRAESLLKQFDLWDVREKRLDSYSKGMRQKIALVRALVHNPPVLFLDEPTTAMDPQSARMVRDAIGELRAADRTILLTTHNLPEAEYLADRIAIIRHGQIIAEGTMNELMLQLLGDPLWEIRLAAPTDPARLSQTLSDLVTVEETGDTFARYHCADSHTLNPRILARLSEQGLAIISIAELTRSLEQVYLHIVSDKPTQEGQTLAQAVTEWQEEQHSEENTHASTNGHAPRTTAEEEAVQ